jgi:chromosome segregation ATPase
MAHIETGVDKLVQLVQKKKRIALEEAAKELGVSAVIVQEWADFLEEEGTITLEYSLSKVFLTEKKLSKHEIENKAKEYEDKKDAFIRKVEVAIENLEKETKSFEKIKEEFLKLKDGLGGEMDKIQGQLSEIHHFESLRKNIDEEINKQRTESNTVLADAEKQIESQQKKYDDIIAKIDKEKTDLKKEAASMQGIEKEEILLKEKLVAMQKIIDMIEGKIKEEHNVITSSEKKIDTLEKMAEKVEDELKKKKTDVVTPLVEMAEQHKEKIVKLQDEIIEKLRQKKNDIETFSAHGKEIAKKFEDFFNKKVEVEKLFVEIEHNKKDLKAEMEKLIDKARVFNAIVSEGDLKKHIQELLERYEEVQTKKTTMRKNMDKLVGMLKV